ncbi:MAG: hypothetical protein ACREDQ_13835, partial [Limisphaerales bacterium]
FYISFLQIPPPPQGFLPGQRKRRARGKSAFARALVRPALRVYGSGMKSRQPSAPVPPEQLKPVLHEKIERMNGEQLALLDRVLLQLEAEQAADRLSEAFDADQAQGKFRRVAELIRQFRAEHRYA